MIAISILGIIGCIMFVSGIYFLDRSCKVFDLLSQLNQTLLEYSIRNDEDGWVKFKYDKITYKDYIKMIISFKPVELESYYTEEEVDEMFK